MSRSSKLYNKDLAPTPSSQKKWGWFEIFNVWANDVQSLFGYTLAASLFIAKVPDGWSKYAYPSKKGLVAWFSDLLSRVNQLDSWAATLTVPKSVWISGLFNGQAFLVSIKQTTARRDQLPLDTMDLLTDITKI